MINMVKIYDDGSSYAWTPEMGKDGIIIRISKSTAGSLGWCAQQMWLQQNYPKPQGLVKHLVVGDDVHNGLDLMYQELEEDKQLLTKLIESNSDLRKYLKGKIPTMKTIVNNRRAENKEFPFYDEDYYRNMNWLVEYENLRMKIDKKNPLPLANEVRIDVKIDVDIEGYGTIPVQFVGIIDRVFKADDGGLLLFELKTGKWKDNKTSEMRKEMSYYKFLIDNCDSAYLKEKGIDHPVTQWGWRYSAADHWTIEPVKKVSERSMMKRLKDLIKMYLDEHFPTTTQDFKCSYCDLIELCPKYAVQVSE
tara:strand:+ start:7114 stop:8031 length:918 start_codon:yes stop_codon:yes gene_type:complete